MLYLLACLLGIFAGVTAKGSVSNIANFKIEKTYLVITAFVIQIVAQMLSIKGISAIQQNSFLVYAVSFMFIAAGFWYNRHYSGILVIGIGCTMNFIVMALNGGKMPVSPESMREAGFEHMIEAMKNGVDGKHILFSESTRLPWLADTIHLPSFLSMFMEVVSIGDLIVVVGLAVLMYEIVKGKRLNWRYSDAKAD